MTVKEEEAVVQAFIKMWKDLTKTGDKLNASQMDAAQKMMKHATDMLSNTKTQKASITMSNKKLKFDEKELVVREKLKVADEHLVKLRHTLNIEQEREHGDQVRRNINLRHNMDSFNDKFDMLKKSLGGGFGFQAAMDKTVKNMGGMTRTFQENKIAGEQYVKAQQTSKDALKKLGIAFLTGDKADQQEASTEFDVAKKAEARSKHNVENTEKIAEKSGVAGRFKPMFAKLDKMGEFLGKKAVPIGLGLGVAGVLMSVIVKSFSASPLFAAMMKMMQFMVRLILMPIGTFFGALLRPILIMLLRKFIIPFYSSAMPTWMALGTQLGEWITTWSWENFEEAIKSINPFYKKDHNNEIVIQEDGTTLMPNGDILDTETGEVLNKDEYIPVEKEKEPENKANPTTEENDLLPPPGSPAYDDGVTDELEADAARSNQWWEKNIWSPLKLFGANLATFGLPSSFAELADGEFDMSGENSMFNGKTPGDLDVETEGEKQVRLDKEERDRAALMESDQERTNRELAEAAAVEAERVAFEHADKAHWMELNRSVLDMNKLMETNGIITEAIPKAMTQEMTNFAAYGMDKPERGGDIKNAGANIAAANARNASAGYTMGGSAKSQSILEAYNAFKNGVTAANGFDGMVNSPTMFLAGEAGSEHVSITPSGESGGSGGITVNIQNMNGSDNDLRKLKQTILEVIQESSANRGRL